MNSHPSDDDANRGDDPLTWAESFVVPDDISELDGDVAQWRAQQGFGQRAGSSQRSERAIPRTMRRYGITTPMVIATLLLIGTLASAMIFLSPRPSVPRRQSAQPLAAVTAAPGTVGALLPNTTLTSAAGSTIELRSLRPALITLVPAGCDCRSAIEHVSAAATPYGTSQYVVATDRKTLDGLASKVLTGSNSFVDGGTLLRLYGSQPQKPTIVVIGADGIVRAIELGASATTTLNQDLDAALAARLAAATG